MPVYNLDVETDHRYLVTDLGVVAHNANISCAMELPALDSTGKVHGELPPKETLPSNWDHEELEYLADELKVSIATRKSLNASLAEDPGHLTRLVPEMELLGTIEQILGQ